MRLELGGVLGRQGGLDKGSPRRMHRLKRRGRPSAAATARRRRRTATEASLPPALPFTHQPHFSFCPYQPLPRSNMGRLAPLVAALSLAALTFAAAQDWRCRMAPGSTHAGCGLPYAASNL